MRGTVPGLASPHPLGGTLPALYADDSFAQRLCDGLDEVLAPVLATLDCRADGPGRVARRLGRRCGSPPDA
jgi:hypothetical protein